MLLSSLGTMGSLRNQVNCSIKMLTQLIDHPDIFPYVRKHISEVNFPVLFFIIMFQEN